MIRRVPRTCPCAPGLVLALLVAAGCAGNPRGLAEAVPGPTAEDREVAQLLATARRAEDRWQHEAATQRELRETVLAVSSAAGLALDRKKLMTLANRSLVEVLSHSDGAPAGGQFVRSQPVTLELAGQPQALVSLLLTLEREAPRFRLGDLTLRRRDPRGSAGYDATLAVDVLERVSVPPPLVPPPVTPSVPLDHPEAVKTLRSHILHLDRALMVARARSAELRKAHEETQGGGRS